MSVGLVMSSRKAIFRMMMEFYFGSCAANRRERRGCELQKKNPGVVFVSVASRLQELCERRLAKIYCTRRFTDQLTAFT